MKMGVYGLFEKLDNSLKHLHLLLFLLALDIARRAILICNYLSIYLAGDSVPSLNSLRVYKGHSLPRNL